MSTIERVKDGLGASMPLTSHLAELRGRLIWSIVAVALAGSVGFYYGPQIITFLKQPLPADVRLIQIELGDGFANAARLGSAELVVACLHLLLV